MSRWSFLTRTVPDLQTLEESTHRVLIPALTNRPPCSLIERKILTLPARLGGLGIPNPCSTSKSSFESSLLLTKPLVDSIIAQDPSGRIDYTNLQSAKSIIKQSNRLRDIQLAQDLDNELDDHQKRLIALAKEKGASSWLTVIALTEHGFSLNKGEFRDALHLRYGWSIPNTPQICNCGNSFSIDHAPICKKGGFPTLGHNEIRDLTASLLSEVCPIVATEPPLQLLSLESFIRQAANVDLEAQLDIKARGFWSRAQDSFFDVRVFHPNAPSYLSQDPPTLYKTHEAAKKREYNK